jgi:hypothetical protein
VRWNEQSDFLDDVLRLCVIVVQYAKSKPSVTKRRQLPHVFHNRNMTALKPTFRPLLYQLRCPCTRQVAYSGVEETIHSLISSAIDGSKWSTSRCGRFTPGKGMLCPDVFGGQRLTSCRTSPRCPACLVTILTELPRLSSLVLADYLVYKRRAMRCALALLYTSGKQVATRSLNQHGISGTTVCRH